MMGPSEAYKYCVFYLEDDVWKRHESMVTWPEVVHLLMYNEHRHIEIERVSSSGD